MKRRRLDCRCDAQGARHRAERASEEVSSWWRRSEECLAVHEGVCVSVVKLIVSELDCTTHHLRRSLEGVWKRSLKSCSSRAEGWLSCLPDAVDVEVGLEW